MSCVETFELAPGYAISRVIRGGWQLAGGHGPIDRATALDDLIAAFDAGVFTFDCADIYTGVEDLFGEMRARLLAARGIEAARRLRVHTKFVPDLDILPSISRRDVERIVDRSLRRLKVDTLDLVQFHWWDYAEPRWLDTLRALDDLRRDGKVRHIGATNFDTAHVRQILDAGIPLVSMQAQYSLIDHRPERSLAALCEAHHVGLLCYGSVAGGFLSDRWLDGSIFTPKIPSALILTRNAIRANRNDADFTNCRWPRLRLLARFSQIDGYRCLSLMRASGVVKCQLALA